MCRTGFIQLNHCACNFRTQGFDHGATVTRGFAAHQVVGLNGGCAFVDGQDFCIAVVLRCTCFFNEAHAAVYLHTGGCHIDTHFSRPAFNQRHHEFIHSHVLLACGFIGVEMGGIVCSTGHASHGARSFNLRTHAHQHALHIGVVNNGNGFVGRAINRARLHAVVGVLHGFLISTLGQTNALNTHLETGGVHHHEHVLQTLVLFTHQVTNRALAHFALVVAIQQHRGWRGLDAQLVFDGCAVHIVAFAQRTVFVHQKLGHYEQADALHAFGRIGGTGKHQVHNVAGHVVFTVGDVDFLARNTIGAIALRHGFGTHQRQV